MDTLAQFEIGTKAPNSLHLVRLAEIYRRDLRELLADTFNEAARDPLTALFRTDTQFASDRERASAVAGWVKLCREYTNLAELERARLKLGDEPLANLAEILEAQAVRFIELPLSENISGLFLCDLSRRAPS